MDLYKEIKDAVFERFPLSNVILDTYSDKYPGLHTYHIGVHCTPPIGLMISKENDNVIVGIFRVMYLDEYDQFEAVSIFTENNVRFAQEKGSCFMIAKPLPSGLYPFHHIVYQSLKNPIAQALSKEDLIDLVLSEMNETYNHRPY